MRKQLLTAIIIAFGFNNNQTSLLGRKSEREYSLFSPALRRLGDQCKKSFVKIDTSQLNNSHQKSIIIKPVCEAKTKSPKLTIIKNPDGIRQIKGISNELENEEQATKETYLLCKAFPHGTHLIKTLLHEYTRESILQKIKDDCRSLVWGKKPELVLDLKNAQDISDHSVQMELYNTLIKEYGTQDISITRFCFEIYQEGALLTKDYEILIEKKHLFSPEEYGDAERLITNYLETLQQLNMIVNLSIMGTSIS